MSETDALIEIAHAIRSLAAAVGGLTFVGWLILLFKSQSSNSSIEKLTDEIKKWAERKRDGK